MKKIVSILLTAVMVVSMFTVFAGAATATPDYSKAKNGDVLYTVDFSGTDGVYAPTNFRNGADKMAATTIEVKDNGKTLVATAPASAGSAYFYGSSIKGLSLGADKQYTITFKAAFPTGNAGVYFNMADLSYNQAVAYNAMYGIYGQIKAGNCMTMSYGAGGKFTAEKVSSADAYTALPEGVENDADGFVTVTFKIDGLFYSVWFNDKLYDQAYITDSVLNICPNLAFAIYLYNANAKFTVKDVVVKKGCDYLQSNSVFGKTSELKYENFKLGQKITDLDFSGKNSTFIPYYNQNSKPASVSMEVTDDGKGIKLATDNVTAGNAHWYGSDIGNLKITDDTKYTIVYKEKDSGSAYAGAVALNGVRFALNAVNRYNWYGDFTGTYKTNVAVKFAYNGTNFTGYNYSDATMTVFNAITPTVDADGYTEIVTELNGWTWTIYMHDANQGDKLVPVRTVNIKTLAEEQSHPIATADNLTFNINIYNKDVTFAVKDASVYKGLTVSETYPVEEPPTTGNSFVWVAFTAMVSILGMGIVIKARKN